MQTTVFILMLSISPILSAKILALAPINGTSHNLWSNAIATGLAERGHEVTFISANDYRGPQHPNLKFIFHQQPERVMKLWGMFLHISFFGSPLEKLNHMDRCLLADCETMFESGPYKDVLESKNQTYDLIMAEYSGHDCLLAFSQKFDFAPIVTVSPISNNPHWILRSAGVPVFPLVPNLAEDKPSPSSFWGRLTSWWVYLRHDFNYYTYVRPSMEKIIKKTLGQDSLSVDKLAENVALSLVNIPNWMNKIPLPAKVIPVAGVHLSESKELSAEMKEFMDGATDGVIIICFGTCIPIEELATNTFRNIASALSKIPQKVLWKWDSNMKDDNITFPKNVWRLPWIPQNDVLGHPNTRLFVSHCGGQSTLEAMYHGVPVLAVPGFWDQNGNADRLVDEKAALRLNFNDITEELFSDTLKELLNNPIYAEGASRLRNTIRDQPNTPLERAVFWIEHVIRNKGARHLRSQLYDLPNYYIIPLDIVIVTVAFMLVLACFVSCILRIYRAVTTTSVKKPKKKFD